MHTGRGQQRRSMHGKDGGTDERGVGGSPRESSDINLFAAS